MIRLTCNKNLLNQENIIFCEIDYFRTYESHQEGNKKNHYKYYTTTELSKDEVIELLECTLEDTIYFSNSSILADLMTEKIAEKIILAPFGWKKITNQEANLLLNTVDMYVTSKTYKNGHKKLDCKHYPQLDNVEQVMNLEPNAEIFDFKLVDNQVEVIFAVNKYFNPTLLQFYIGKNKLDVYYHERVNRVMMNDNLIFYGVKLPIDRKGKCKIMYLNQSIVITHATTIKQNQKNLYKLKNGYYYQIKDDSLFSHGQLRLRSKLKLEYKYLKSINDKKIRNERLQILLTKSFIRNNKILVSDRVQFAKDNGEEFYRYLMNNKVKHSYYILSKDSPDYERLKAEGFNIIEQGSLRHKLYLYNYKLLCFSNLSTSRYHYYPTKDVRYFSDLQTGKRIFLQHGVSWNNIAPLYNDYKHDLDGFVCSGDREYEYLKSLDFRDDLINCGFPRYDKLHRSHDGDYILAFFTWRQSLTKIGASTGVEGFERTEYFKQLYRTVNDPDIISALSSKGLRLKLFLHPNMQLNEASFAGTGNYDICNGDNADITKLIRESKMLITDFSSVAFDVSYQNKPVISYQFDKEDFHYINGMDLDEENLTDVYTEFEPMKKAVLDLIENNFEISESRERSVDKFFGKRDNKNSERLYEYLLNKYLS